jgi:hypothetical protein
MYTAAGTAASVYASLSAVWRSVICTSLSIDRPDVHAPTAYKPMGGSNLSSLPIPPVERELTLRDAHRIHFTCFLNRTVEFLVEQGCEFISLLLHFRVILDLIYSDSVASCLELELLSQANQLHVLTNIFHPPLPIVVNPHFLA